MSAQTHVLIARPGYFRYHNSIDAAKPDLTLKIPANIIALLHTDFTSYAENSRRAILVYGVARNQNSNTYVKAEDLLSLPNDSIRCLEGQFLCAIVQKAQGSLEIISDYVGTRALYFHISAQSAFGMTCAQTPQVLSALIGIPLEIDTESFKEILPGISPTPALARPTHSKGISRLCGGSILCSDQLGVRTIRNSALKSLDQAISETSHLSTQSLSQALKAAIVEAICRVGDYKMRAVLDISGGLDSGVIYGVLRNKGLAPLSANSLISPSVLAVEHRNLMRWALEPDVQLSFTDITNHNPEEYIATSQHRFFGTCGGGIYHLDYEAEIAQGQGAKVRILGYGPDEFLSNSPISSRLSDLTQRASLGPLYVSKSILRDAFKWSVAVLPPALASKLAQLKAPSWFLPEIKVVYGNQTEQLYTYLQGLQYKNTVENRQYKLDFYRSRNSQLPINDLLSVERNIYCYYPYLDDRVIHLSSALSLRVRYFDENDDKRYFRNLMSEYLPSFLLQEHIENENFANLNSLQNNRFLNENTWENSPLFQFGYIDERNFYSALKKEKIPRNHLNWLFSHDRLLSRHLAI